MKQCLENTTRLRVRYAETDAMGVAYNGNYFTYYEVARVELMRKFNLTYADLERDGYQLPVVETGAKYIKSALYDDELDVKAVCRYEKGVRINFDYYIYRNGELLSEGFSKHAFIDSSTKRPVKPPKQFVDTYKEVTGE